MKLAASLAVAVACGVLAGCSNSDAPAAGEAQAFLRMYNDIGQRLSTVANQAAWNSVTDVNERTTGERIGAEKALAAFQGSRHVIETSRRLLAGRDSLTDLEFRQLDKILLTAAEWPATIPEVVNARIEGEARLRATLNGFTFCLETRAGKCLRSITPNQIDEVLRTSTDLRERRRIWEISKQTGPVLKPELARVRDLRNRVATELGYSSYFHLQVADYGMSVAEMMRLMNKAVTDTTPLYRQLCRYARRKLAARYGQPAPERIPAHWLPDRWGQDWPGLAGGVDLDEQLRGRRPEWIIEQAERFCTSLGWPSLPKSFWERSDLFQLPPGAARKKNSLAWGYQIDLDHDVRSLMSIVPDWRWFETAHHELGHIYYYLAYSDPKIPVVLRGGPSRAFHEAVGSLLAVAARQEPYLRQIGLIPSGAAVDRDEWLLAEALNNAVVFIPWSAGTMTHFEYDLYEKRIPQDAFNRDWWGLAAQYQQIQPPAVRGEDYCDGCTKTHVIDDPAQYYDYALANLIRYQLHDYIARRILRQDPHSCNYYGNKEVGKWLWDILSLGAARDWRDVLREKTGEDIGTRAMVEYFRPLEAYLAKLEAAAGRP